MGCGKHRHRHKSSSGSSPAPSLKSHHQSSSSLKPNHQRTASQPERTEQNETLKSTTENVNTGGYEPVGTNLALPPQTSDKKCVSRSPSSKLPTLPSQDGDDSDTTVTCFPLRRSRSRSKERKGKKSSLPRRSPSRDSGCSEHAYETPKLLQKRQPGSAPEVDRTSKPSVKKKARSDLEDGYEPVGKPIDVITAVISHGKQGDSEDAAVRNIENRDEPSAMEHIIHKETIMKDFGIYNDHLSDENVVHLQRDLNSDKPSENCLTKKELKKKKAEEEKLLKEEKKKLKQQKEKEEREEKQKQKLLKKEEKLAKEKEIRLKKEKSKQENKEIQEGKKILEIPKVKVKTNQS